MGVSQALLRSHGDPISCEPIKRVLILPEEEMEAHSHLETCVWTVSVSVAEDWDTKLNKNVL